MKKINQKPGGLLSKAKKYAYWTVTALLAFIMFFGGIAEILHQWDTLQTHTILLYPVYVLTIIGMWKVLGTFAILLPKFPRLKEWVYAGMFFDITGAFISHAAVGDLGAGVYHLLTTGLIAGIVLASWALRPESRTLKLISSSTFEKSRKPEVKEREIELLGSITH